MDTYTDNCRVVVFVLLSGVQLEDTFHTWVDKLPCDHADGCRQVHTVTTYWRYVHIPIRINKVIIYLSELLMIKLTLADPHVLVEPKSFQLYTPSTNRSLLLREGKMETI